MANRLGELLVRDSLVAPAALAAAQAEQERTGERLGAILVRRGDLSEDLLVEYLAKQYGAERIKLADFEIDADVIKLVTPDRARRLRAIPLKRHGGALIVVTDDPANVDVETELRFATSFNITVVVASDREIDETLKRYYDDSMSYAAALEGVSEEDLDIVVEDDGEVDITSAKKSAEEAPVVKLVNAILVNAIKLGASDIHIEPYEKAFRLRYRIDGVLHEQPAPPFKLRAPIVSRLKILAQANIAERRVPQGGRIKLKYEAKKEIDYRVSILPTLFGEKIVLRLLDKSNLQLDMRKLGFADKQLVAFSHAVHQPFGMVLVTGPTGSGKTTTLYSALSELNKVSENICTAEDPVEYNLFGINQVQMNDDVGLTFATALREFLRQDPDIVMVGEIRDFETAEMAVKAALTGHMVLSTLHTNDAASAITRLVDMGIEPFLVASAIDCVVGQRLARRLCQHCKERQIISADVLRANGIRSQFDMEAYQATGCSRCNHSGYKGRVGLYEVMVVSEEIRKLALARAPAPQIAEVAVRQGMRLMRDDGLEKVRHGMTSIQEVTRVTGSGSAAIE
ncbi:MAG: type IV-A pilus assembly ATPase PilB [Solirubrobacteraceae bacterium]|nr:type IV-A pilus assembly ATPase PilB [Solirubrobacteraceae bacterium]